MPRPKRSAAMFAAEKIKAVLDWEELPESSSKFKQYAAQIDAEFEEEQKKKRVKVEDLEDLEDLEEDDENDDTGQEGGGGRGDDDWSMDGSTDEMPTKEDLDFIEKDSDYESSDGDFVTAESELDSEEETEDDEEGEQILEEEINGEDDTEEDAKEEDDKEDHDKDNDTGDDREDNREDDTENHVNLTENKIENNEGIQQPWSQEAEDMTSDLGIMREEGEPEWGELMHDDRMLERDMNVASWTDHMLTFNQTYIC